MQIYVHTISIHILHAEDDASDVALLSGNNDFNPHPPCGGWRHCWHYAKVYDRFQSTSSMRRMTRKCRKLLCIDFYFNPHPPCGGWRPVLCVFWHDIYNFNPHPPCGGWLFSVNYLMPHQRFQSTSSMRRMTSPAPGAVRHMPISIHILHAEDDTAATWFRRCHRYFNPHPPCGGWLQCRLFWKNQAKFQSTSSMRRMTGNAGRKPTG